MSGSDDDIIIFDDLNTFEVEQSYTNFDSEWVVLIVDDDADVINVTTLAFSGICVDQKKVILTHAESAESAKNLLISLENIAVVITDAIMESENSGIDLIKWIREQESLSATRLVLRTGQPGRFYEEDMIQNLDINDYWPKTELTANRMRTILIGLIRSYRDIKLAYHKALLDKQE